MDKFTRGLGIFLVIYLLVVGSLSAAFVVIAFPTETDGKHTYHFVKSPEQCLFLLAMASGLAGSFIHGAQSLSSYLGNVEFKASWTAWYLLRPWIGAILGMTIYVAFRAGLMGGGSMNPYGVVAVGLLGGWFSKTTTDKMQEVFATLFKTDADKNRQDKLQATQPNVDRVEPSPVPAGQNEIVIYGNNFLDGAVVIINGQEFKAQFGGSSQLRLSLAALAAPRPLTDATLRVRNPTGVEPISNAISVEIQ
jgi:uncharacterized membrane protein YeaQ/YmgE (transglycosylase-associated protein family)